MRDPLLVEQQFALEAEQTQIGIDRYRKSRAEITTAAIRAGGGIMVDQLHEQMPPEQRVIGFTLSKVSLGIAQWLERTERVGSGAGVKKELLQLDPDVLAFITLRRLVNATYQPGLAYQTVCTALGNDIGFEIFYSKFTADKKRYLAKIQDNLKSKSRRHAHRVIVKAAGTKGYSRPQWTPETTYIIGDRLASVAIEATGIFDLITVPAPIKGTMYSIRAKKQLTNMLEAAHGQAEMANPYHMPMVVRPNEWTTINNGGYLTNDASGAYRLIKTWADVTKTSQEFMKAVNILQDTAYRINTKVLDVLKVAYDEGVGMGGTPNFQKDIIVPPKPWASDEERQKIKADTPELYKQMNKKLARGHEEWHTETAKRSTFSNQIHLAKKFQGYKEIFFTWTADFRGRLYPQQAALNPQMDDAAKGLLEFAHGKPLGTESGLRWLMIQGANTFGIDKVSFDARVQWVRDHEAQILESANNPLDGDRFWCTADEPWEFLAFCFAYQGYKKEGLSYVCHLPISIDGSCNGLQHLSMMLRDQSGIKVNLVERDEPGDIYGDAAALVIEMVKKDSTLSDAQIGVKLSDKKKDGVITLEDIQRYRNQARIWDGKVTRSIVKRNIMTICYGATKMGFRGQLEKAVHDEGKDYLGVGDDEDVIYRACGYLADKTWEAACQLLPVGMEFMEWLQKLGRTYGSNGAVIGYETPMGFPVVMDYKDMKETRVETYWGDTRKRITLAEPTKNIDSRRLGLACAPNFVHSLDACHMQMVLLEADKRGMRDYKCVHDSFGTHACDMELFHTIVWETFRDLYKDDILDTLFAEIRQYAFDTAGTIPVTTWFKKRGNLDIPKKGKPLYFFA